LWTIWEKPAENGGLFSSFLQASERHHFDTLSGSMTPTEKANKTRCCGVLWSAGADYDATALTRLKIGRHQTCPTFAPLLLYFFTGKTLLNVC